MPRGPRGFPRLTSLGPFVDEDSEQEFTIREIDDVLPPAFGVPEDLLKAGAISDKHSNRVIMELILREPIKSEFSGPLGEMERAFEELVRDVTVAEATYYYWPREKVAMIGRIHVEGEFRRQGIGTEIKERVNRDMEERGIDIAYTVIASEEGKRLAERTGFSPDDGIFKDDESVWSRRF